MNPIERLRDDLASRFPGVMTELDPPADAAGLWQLDVRSGEGAPWIVVEWQPELGFGVSTPGSDDYGTKPDEAYPNARAAYDRVAQLILSGGQTKPPEAVRLAELRRLRNLSQTELAGRAGIKQAAMARIEGRGDILLSTLRRVVSAMGGRLSIRVEFPDGTERDLIGLIQEPHLVMGQPPAVAGQQLSTSAKTPGRGAVTGGAEQGTGGSSKPQEGKSIDVPGTSTGRLQAAPQRRGRSSSKQTRKASTK